MEYETEYMRLFALQFGGKCVSAPRGTFTALLEVENVQVGEIGVDSELPKLTARTSDVLAAGVSHGATLGIEGQTYIVRSMQHDRTGENGLGMTTMILEGP